MLLLPLRFVRTIAQFQAFLRANRVTTGWSCSTNTILVSLRQLQLLHKKPFFTLMARRGSSLPLRVSARCQ